MECDVCQEEFKPKDLTYYKGIYLCKDCLEELENGTIDERGTTLH